MRVVVRQIDAHLRRTSFCVLFLFGLLPCCSGDEDNGAGATTVTPEAVDPGVCVGAGLSCELPAISPLSPGPEVTCARTSGGQAPILWSDSVAELDCPAGRCPAITRDVAMGSDGAVWVYSLLYLPGAAEIGGADASGVALLRYSAEGTRTLTSLVEFRTELAGPIARPQGMHVDDRGHLFWAQPAQGSPGIDFSEYAPSGALVKQRRIVEHATSGVAAFGSSASMFMAYSYDEPSEGGVPNRRGSIALFGSAGQLRFNQTALFDWIPPPRAFLALADPDWGLGTPLAVNGPLPASRGAVLSIAADGSVGWIRDLAAPLPASVALPDGGAFVLVTRPGGRPSKVTLYRMDAQGNTVWQVSGLPLVLGTLSTLHDGEPLLIEASSCPLTLTRVSKDGTSCMEVIVQPPDCDGGVDSLTAMTATGRFAFAVSHWIGVATLPTK